MRLGGGRRAQVLRRVGVHMPVALAGEVPGQVQPGRGRGGAQGGGRAGRHQPAAPGGAARAPRATGRHGAGIWPPASGQSAGPGREPGERRLRICQPGQIPGCSRPGYDGFPSRGLDLGRSDLDSLLRCSGRFLDARLSGREEHIVTRACGQDLDAGRMPGQDLRRAALHDAQPHIFDDVRGRAGAYPAGGRGPQR